MVSLALPAYGIEGAGAHALVMPGLGPIGARIRAILAGGWREGPVALPCHPGKGRDPWRRRPGARGRSCNGAVPGALGAIASPRPRVVSVAKWVPAFAGTTEGNYHAEARRTRRRSPVSAPSAPPRAQLLLPHLDNHPACRPILAPMRPSPAVPEWWGIS